MRCINTMIKYVNFIKGVMSNIRFVKNWWLPILIRLGVVSEGYAILRTGEVVKLSKSNWHAYLIRRNLAINKGVITYSLSRGYVAKLSYANLWAPNTDLLAAVINEDLISSYPREYFHDKVVIDVGAYIGDTTVLFSKYYGAKKVVAVEPNPIHYKALLINLRLNKVVNAKALNKALCSEEDNEVCINGLGHSAKVTELKDSRCSNTIKCVSLEQLII